VNEEPSFALLSSGFVFRFVLRFVFGPAEAGLVPNPDPEP
jgi:hypothetical protein